MDHHYQFENYNIDDSFDDVVCDKCGARKKLGQQDHQDDKNNEDY